MQAVSAARVREGARRLLVQRLRLVPPDADVRRYALPGAARATELRWRAWLRRRPTLSVEAYGATVAVEAREELLGCQLCGGRELQPLFAPGRPGRWGYRVVRCTGCGFLYRNPGIRPERLGDLYSGGNYAKFLTGDYARGRQDGYRRIMDRFAPLFAAGGGRRLLDYGCGAGLFLELAHERGFDAHGVDLSPDSVEAAHARPGGGNAHLGAPEDVPEIAAGGFDVVTLWSVLAHLPRPADDIARLRRLLTDDGVLLISTVNANSLTLKAHRDRWGGFTPNHLVFFSPTTLPALLRRAGLRRGRVPPDVRRSRRGRDRGPAAGAGAAPAQRRRPRQPGAHAACGRVRRPRGTAATRPRRHGDQAVAGARLRHTPSAITTASGAVQRSAVRRSVNASSSATAPGTASWSAELNANTTPVA